MKAAVLAENLTKKYPLRSPFGDGRRSRRKEKGTLWALNGVSFRLEPGEAVGFIGHNGAGKSTLLKILSRITEPTSGRAILRGRVASLLGVGAGFHLELSGLENIYLNGAVLGMRKREIDRRLDEIVDFAGVDRFVHTPIKHYSNGMHIRLAFSIAACLEADILLVDEILTAGDEAFQRKSFLKMEEAVSRGKVVLLVSHDLPSVRKLCSRSYLMEKGAIAAAGATSEVIDLYCRSLEA